MNFSVGLDRARLMRHVIFCPIWFAVSASVVLRYVIPAQETTRLYRTYLDPIALVK